jgi:hypothetical protein
MLHSASIQQREALDNEIRTGLAQIARLGQKQKPNTLTEDPDSSPKVGPQFV